MKTLEDERYVVIKAYKCTVSEIWREIFLYWHVLRVRRIPTYRVYRLCDKCTVSEIWRDFFVLACIACTSYPYIQSLPTL